MISGRRVVAVIPARSGSKSVPGKNIRDLAGKPLIAWTIETALNTPEIDRIIVSTDGEKITEISRKYGAEVYPRPAELATDEALVIDTLRHLRKQLKKEKESAEYMVLLEPTAPFRLPTDISECLNILESNKLDSIATFVESSSNPHRAWKIDSIIPKPFIVGSDPWLPRQSLPVAWHLNGGVYAFLLDRLPDEGRGLLFGKYGSVCMPQERSIDVDSETDFLVAEKFIKNINSY
jgi:CMP-N,N'-diacetyllegionaminic acid synthase